VLPPAGVYAVEVLHDGEPYFGVANHGPRPTVDASPEASPRLEVHVFDLDADLYGAQLEVAFVARIRDQRRFDGLAALRAQIADDAARARRLTRGR
jgi:riboflavin kinase/FMN adenylyltransferase